MPRDLNTLLSYICRDYTDVVRFQKLLPHVPVAIRKALMTLCRVQQDPSVNRRLFKAISSALQWSTSALVDYTQTIITFRDLSSVLLRYIHRPVILGYISMVLRVIPILDEDSVYEELQAGINKEVSCALSSDIHQQLDYRCLFPNKHEERWTLHDWLPERRELSLRLRQSLIVWKANLEHTILYPTYQRTKTVGDLTSARYHAMRGMPAKTFSDVTTWDLEELYSTTGVETSGPCEIRWAWKYNDLKPRVYYAQGGSAYFAARYIRDIANLLCDISPVSARLTRYSLSRLHPVDDHHQFAVYDYSSFTSRMTELKHFLRELAQFCVGTTIWLVDTYHGLIQEDLGHLIESYNQEVNCGTMLDISRIFEVREGGPVLEPHRRSGPLGCYGNIVFSTALHGIFLAYIAGSETKACCVGDDAGGLFANVEWSVPDLLSTLQLLGDVAAEKTEVWRKGSEQSEGENGWQFLKRPVDRLSNQLLTGILFDFPLAVYAASVPQDFHTVDLGSSSDQIKAFVMQFCRLLDRLHQYSHRISDEDVDFVLSFATACYRNLQLPVEGALPPVPHPRLSADLRLAIPILHTRSIREPWLDVLCNEFAGVLFTLPKTTYDKVGPSPFITVGQQFECSGHRALQLGIDMGFLEKEMEVKMIRMDEASAIMLNDFMCGDLMILYNFTFIESPPLWWRQLILL